MIAKMIELYLNQFGRTTDFTMQQLGFNRGSKFDNASQAILLFKS